MTELQSEELLPPFSRARFAVAVSVAIALVMVTFTVFPILDLAPSEYFYMPGPVSWNNSAWNCRGYALACQPALVLIRDFLHVLPLILGTMLLLPIGWYLWRRHSLFDRHVLRYGTAFWSLVIGNLLVVDFLLKEHWGRPRPYHQYIGEARFESYSFMPVGDWGGACVSNCSFVSGEANALFWMVCATAILPAGIRKPAFIVALVLATAGSMLRVAFGAHYISDVVVGGLLAALIFSLIAIIAAQIDRRAGFRSENYSS